MAENKMPEPPEPDALYRLIVEVRRAFHDLGAYADALHADLEITAAMRAVMEYLADNGPETVPNIARDKKVTRQHIQQLADALVARGMAKWVDNPRHKRSKLLELSPAGEKAFAEIRRREAGALRRLASHFEHDDVQRASETLGRLRRLAANPD